MARLWINRAASSPEATSRRSERDASIASPLAKIHGASAATRLQQPRRDHGVRARVLQDDAAVPLAAVGHVRQRLQ